MKRENLKKCIAINEEIEVLEKQLSQINEMNCFVVNSYNLCKILEIPIYDSATGKYVEVAKEFRDKLKILLESEINELNQKLEQL